MNFPLTSDDRRALRFCLASRFRPLCVNRPRISRRSFSVRVISLLPHSLAFLACLSSLAGGPLAFPFFTSYVETRFRPQSALPRDCGTTIRGHYRDFAGNEARSLSGCCLFAPSRRCLRWKLMDRPRNPWVDATRLVFSRDTPPRTLPGGGSYDSD